MPASEPYGFVYLITNLLTEKYYIGQTTQAPERRFASHIAEATKGRAGCKYFHRAITKYGPDAFRLEVLSVAYSLEQLLDLERAWISVTKATDRSFGYNLEYGGRGPGKLLPETKEKISRALTGRILSPEHVEHARLAGIGKKRTQETKDRISQALLRPETSEKLRLTQLGKPKKPEAIEKTRQANIGRLVSDETRALMSVSSKGRKVSDETRKKISLGVASHNQKQGRPPVSDETRLRMSISAKARKDRSQVNA